MILLPGLAWGADPFRLIVGYSPSAIENTYVEDGKRVFKTMVGSYLGVADPEIQAELVTFQDEIEMGAAIKLGRVDMVAGSADQTVKSVRNRVLDPAFVTETAGSVYEDAVLIVRKDSAVMKLADLRGKRLMTLEGARFGNHHRWLDTWTLREANVRVGPFFASVKEGRTSSKVVLACFFGGADACLVPRGGYELASEMNPQILERMKVLGSSTNLIGAIVAFRADLEPQKKARVARIMARLHEDPRGRQILKIFRRSRLVAFKPEYLAGIEALIGEHEQLLRLHGAPARAQ
jgi:ABC-type phosphate/phosphonate transport system substrate-binding protein